MADTSSETAAVLPSEEQLKKLKVADLKELCRTRKLAVSGTKPVLLARPLGQAAPEVSAKKAKPAAKDNVTPATKDAIPTSSQASISSQPPSRSSSIVAPQAKKPTKKKADEAASAPSAKKVKTSTVSKQSKPSTTANTPFTAPAPLAPPQAASALFQQGGSTKDIVSISITEPSSVSRAQVNTNRSDPKASRNTAPSSSIATNKETDISPAQDRPSTFTRTQPQPSRSTFASPIARPQTPSIPIPPAVVIILAKAAGSKSVAPKPSKKIVNAVPQAPFARPPKQSQFSILRPTGGFPTASSTPLNQSATPLDTSIIDKQDLEDSSTWIAAAMKASSIRSLVPTSVYSDTRQLRIALAFYSTRIYTTLGTERESGETDLSKLPRVESIQDLVPGVAIVNLDDNSSFYVLIQSGEVIGTERNAELNEDDQEDAEQTLRSDWLKYIEQAQTSSAIMQEWEESLFKLVQSPDVESFANGISKHYLKRLQNMEHRESARKLLQAAHAYVLAHVAPNAISGSYLSVSDQQAEFAGANIQFSSAASKRAKVGLFLPITHQVESVSLDKLNPAVAIVQTVHRSHYVLRLTGQIIGEEDDGVLYRFQEMLSCDASGRAI